MDLPNITRPVEVLACGFREGRASAAGTPAQSLQSVPAKHDSGATPN